jgi:uncharacterized membrane protein (UPF0127 family)
VSIPTRRKLRQSATSLAALTIISALCFLLAACSDSSAKEEPPPPGITRINVIDDKGKKQRLDIEIADTSEERATGLMNRQELAENSGMLFVFTQRGRGFYMKDTLIPLSVAFISECGEIVHIADMEPKTLTLHNTDKPYKYGLEVNQGWFASHNISAGATVEIPAEHATEGCA